MMLNKKQMISKKHIIHLDFILKFLLSGLITVLIFASLFIPQSTTYLLISIILFLLINSGFLIAMKNDNILVKPYLILCS